MQSFKAETDEIEEAVLAADSDPLYAFFAKKLADKAWFSLWGPITDASCELAGQFLLDLMLNGKKQATIFICSPGGSPDDSKALISIIELCKANGMTIRVYGSGCIASAAFDIFTACSKGFRFCFETTMFMTHGTSGHVEEKEMYDLQCQFDKWHLKQYTSMHASTRERFLKTGNWWFDGKDAIAYGVADFVVKTGKPLPEGPVLPPRKTKEQQVSEAVQSLNGDDDVG